jgi:hypothetical protein
MPVSLRLEMGVYALVGEIDSYEPAATCVDTCMYFRIWRTMRNCQVQLCE